MSDIHFVINEFRKARSLAYGEIFHMFPAGTPVRIKTSNGTTIYGKVHHISVSTPDLVSCLLENGNVWDYPVEQLTVVKQYAKS